MTRNGSIWILTAALAFAAASDARRAQQVSEARIRELIEPGGRARREWRSATRQQPAQPAPGETTPTVRLTLDDAVKFALDRNLDIAVQRLNPQINDIADRRASGRSTTRP